MMIHPQFNPVALSLGPLAIRWYGLMYLLAFALFLLLGHGRIKRNPAPVLTSPQLDDFLFYGVLGVILGGRLGYVLFYKFGDYLANPLSILKVWEGGMSFHGGFIGVMLAMWYFGRREGKTFFQIADFVAPLVPLGLAFGRVGNFINGELWGRVTSADAWWAMLFPQARVEDAGYVAAHPQWQSFYELHRALPRHASQLYQIALEGVALFVILWLFSRKPRPTGQVSALFLIGYGAFRFIAEFAREPDSFLGLLAANLSMGQWLSLPMVLAGVALFVVSSRKQA